MPKKGVCAFCGVYGELDREHYIGLRFRKLFPIKHQPEYGQLMSVYDPSTGRYRQEAVRRSRTPWRLTVEVGKTCCNNRWMRDLDESVSPFLNHALTSEPRHVPASLAAALAGWAAKVAALHELSGRRPEVVIQLSDRQHIKHHLRPPRGTRVWLAARDWRPTMLPSVDQTGFRLGGGGAVAGQSVDRDSHSTTISFGHAVFQLWGTRTPRMLSPGGPVGDRFVRIWPYPARSGITWPDGKLLTVDEAFGLPRSIEHHFTGRIAPIGEPGRHETPP
jgi:hypothetical protein